MKIVFLCFFVLITVSVSSSYAQSTEEIKEVLRQFQAGYSKRDTGMAEQFASSLFAKDIRIIGTGNDEWVSGYDAAKKLVINDWAYWMNFKIDTPGTIIMIFGSTAMFSVKGGTSVSFPTKDIAYDFAAQQIQRVIAAEKTSKGKLLAWSKEASDWIREIERGGLAANYEIRLAGTLVKKDNKWLFQQLIFSYPYPMVRKD
jgi:hypothetical protein